MLHPFPLILHQFNVKSITNVTQLVGVRVHIYICVYLCVCTHIYIWLQIQRHRAEIFFGLTIL